MLLLWLFVAVISGRVRGTITRGAWSTARFEVSGTKVGRDRSLAEPCSRQVSSAPAASPRLPLAAGLSRDARLLLATLLILAWRPRYAVIRTCTLLHRRGHCEVIIIHRLSNENIHNNSVTKSLQSIFGFVRSNSHVNSECRRRRLLAGGGRRAERDWLRGGT